MLVVRYLDPECSSKDPDSDMHMRTRILIKINRKESICCTMYILLNCCRYEAQLLDPGQVETEELNIKSKYQPAERGEYLQTIKD